MEYRDEKKITQVWRIETTQIPLCDGCHDDAEYYNDDYEIAWCEDCAYDIIMEAFEYHVGYEYTCDKNPEDVEIVDENPEDDE